MRGDGKHRLMIAMTVVQPVDQMQVAGPTTARADGELAGGRGIGAGGEGRDLFVARMHPANRTEPLQAI